MHKCGESVVRGRERESECIAHSVDAMSNVKYTQKRDPNVYPIVVGRQAVHSVVC